MSVNKERYARQIALPEIGLQGQQALANAKVLVVGAGGLGCPVLQYLAAAGVGKIGIVDGDRVDLSNLHRQVLFGVDDIGDLKVKAAAAAIQRINPEINVKEYPFFLHNVLALKLLPKYDIIVDGTDNFATRYLLNDACALLQKPLVFAALSQWEAQLGVLHVPLENGTRGINYRDIFPAPPAPEEVMNCAQAGVLGVLPGIIGTMQAAEVIKLITGAGNLLNNEVLIYNVKKATQYSLKINRVEGVQVPQDERDFLQTNYEWLCGGGEVREISARDVGQMISNGAVFVDVRELDETPDLPVPHQRIPLSQLRREKFQVEGKDVVVVCHMGVRSLEAVRLMNQWAPAGQKLYSLKGGIMALAAAVSNATT